MTLSIFLFLPPDLGVDEGLGVGQGVDGVKDVDCVDKHRLCRGNKPNDSAELARIPYSYAYRAYVFLYLILSPYYL